MGDEPAVMVDDSFWSRPAMLVALAGPAPTRNRTEIHGSAVRQATLAELVALVMETHPAERWRYSIVTDNDPWMTATDIEAAAYRDDFPFPAALDCGRHAT
jgi:hypothetical protein